MLTVNEKLKSPLLTYVERKDTQREWGHFDKRMDYVTEIAWFILTDEVARRLGEFLKGQQVVEVFAGSGYLAHHLRQYAGLSRKEYRAYDNGERRGWKSKLPSVTKKNAFMAPIKSADSIVMTWPDYATHHASRIVKKMVSGQYLVFNGEGYGGCTGNDEFFNILENDFVEIEPLTGELNDYHVRFGGIHDHWTIFRKK